MLIFKKSTLIKNYFIVEGLKENKHYIYNFKIKYIFICKILLKNINKIIYLNKFKKKIIYIKKKIYNKIVYRKNKEGIFILYKKKIYNLKTINLFKNKILIILDNIEKPSNIGTIIRTLYGLNIKNLILINYKNNIYNNNIIRSSLGYILKIKIIITKIKQLLYFINKNKIKLYITNTKNKISYNLYKKKFKNKNIAIILGSEKNGISDKWKKYKIKYKNLNIPTININSLNVSIALSIIIYEIFRQNYY
ncbi:MAG: TrmH family RNA methyltransferase [Candidatus Shikimatogenerans sp. AspAUS03]|uniref:TrmH family RNA methyltransferase n=1 Tax=Candidatus Shikimatogenerans sp. AspAUS03 TaxID=3158563 RepID=A0AAU7QSD9_9FLAO